MAGTPATARAAASTHRRHGSEQEAVPQLAQAVERALTMLETFSARRPQLGVLELARALGSSPSTTSRLLAALEQRGYVAQDDATGRYRLGVRALELGYRFADTDELILRAAPHLDALAQQLKLRGDLYRLESGQLLRYLTANYPPGQTMTGGWRFYPYTSAAGRVLLAFLPEGEQAVLVRGGQLLATLHERLTVDRLQAQLEAIRLRGYDMDDDAAGVGKRSLSVPVRDASGGVIAALSVTGPASRLVDAEIPAILEVVFDRAFEMSKALGYRPYQALCEPASEP